MSSEVTAGRHARLQELRHFWWFLALGGVAAVLGVVSLDFPWSWTRVSTALLGWLFLVVGLLSAIHGFRNSFILQLLAGGGVALVGLLLVVISVEMGVALLLVVAGVLLLGGSARTALAWFRRPPGRVWLLLNTFLTPVLGLLMWRECGWVTTYLALTFAPPLEAGALAPGNYTRSFPVGEQTRSYLVHVPMNYDPTKATPVVLALHGASMNGPLMAVFCGLNQKADQDGFLVVYPNGAGIGCFRFWNPNGMEDVEFIRQTLDDLGTVASVDQRQVFACGMSDGGMMCYLLAATLPHRLAAIAPVGGSILTPSVLQRSIPLIHFHGTADAIISFQGGRPVEESIQTWAKLNGCRETPATEQLSKATDEMTVTQKTYSPGRGGAEVVLVVVEGGGHNWPGQKPLVAFLGKSPRNVAANDLIWDFFTKHPLKE